MRLKKMLLTFEVGVFLVNIATQLAIFSLVLNRHVCKKTSAPRKMLCFLTTHSMPELLLRYLKLVKGLQKKIQAGFEDRRIILVCLVN